MNKLNVNEDLFALAMQLIKKCNLYERAYYEKSVCFKSNKL